MVAASPVYGAVHGGWCVETGSVKVQPDDVGIPGDYSARPPVEHYGMEGTGSMCLVGYDRRCGWRPGSSCRPAPYTLASLVLWDKALLLTTIAG